MNIISVEKLTKWQSGKKLFEDISFGIEDNQKIALIGINGTGKSTLLRIIFGTEFYDAGNISRKKDIKINFLKQIPDFEPESTIFEHIYTSESPKVKLIRRFEEASEKAALDPENPQIQQELEKAMEEMENNQAWQYEYEIKSVLNELGITNLALKMSTLSGGMLKKVALAQTLIDDVDLTILDEPTNHLDVDTIQWMESYLNKMNKAILMVTHDRYIVDSVCNTIFELDKGNLFQYQGNYSYYLERRAEYENSLVQEEMRVNSVLRRELEWMKRGAQGRQTKQRARIDRFQDLMNRDTVKQNETVELSFSGRRLGKKILELDKVSKNYDGKQVVKPFTYKFRQKERIGIVGHNGSGKTTFLNLLTEKIKPDTGVVDKGINTHFGYFDQYSHELDPEMKVIDFIKSAALIIELSNGKKITASQMLERFLFPGPAQHSKIGTLSGGEKRRLYLLYILMQNPNFLVFDEPTNDLDIKTLSVLEDFLNEFDGCLLVVSHDRYFMDRVVDYLFIFDGKGNIQGFPGDYSEFLAYKKEQEAEAETAKKEEKKAVAVPVKQKEKTKLSFNEKYELEKLEKEIEKLEAEKAELDKLFSSGENDFDKISKWNERYKILTETLDKKMERWEYLASFEY